MEEADPSQSSSQDSLEEGFDIMKTIQALFFYSFSITKLDI